MLRQLDGKPFYERARRRDPVLDAAIRDAVSACTGQATGNKYHAVQTEVDGIRFDSKAEAARCLKCPLRLQLHRTKLWTEY